MKIIKLERVEKSKFGRTIDNGVKSENHENLTAKYLNEHGLNIEKVIPSQTPKTNNPDYFMLGSIWEVKAPTTSNENTLKNRFRKAAKQTSGYGKVIFDLRGVKQNYAKVEKLVITFFEGNRCFRRMILVRKNGDVLDYQK